MENLNEIIDNLCNKLGTTAEFLIPEYAKMRIAEAMFLRNVYGFIVIINILFFIISSYLFTKHYRNFNYREKDMAEGGILAVSIICAILIVFGGVEFFANHRDVIIFTVSPTAATIKELLGGIK